MKSTERNKTQLSSPQLSPAAGASPYVRWEQQVPEVLEEPTSTILEQDAGRKITRSMGCSLGQCPGAL